MNIKKSYLRFNIDKEDDRKAWETLINLDKSTHKSVNRFVISLINKYSEENYEKNQNEDFRQNIISTIREELRAFSPYKLFQNCGQADTYVSSSSYTDEKNTTENEENVMDFIDNFCGGK